MRFRCDIEMGNAAFTEPDPEDPPTYSVVDEDGVVPESDQCAGIELARLLRKVADEVETGMRFPMNETATLLDRNGNTVGQWTVGTPEREYTTCAICDGPIDPDDHKVVPWPDDGRELDEADEIAHADCALNDA